MIVPLSLNETCNDVHVDNNQSDAFPIQSGTKQDILLSLLFFNFTVKYAIKEVPSKAGGFRMKWNTSISGL